MKKVSCFITLALLACGPAAWAIPSSITYQGSLKQAGLPASGNKNMLFRITNQDGTQVYWSSGNMVVSVANGLFSAHITPTGVDWQTVTPYIEVSVEGQLLQPREPVNATVYASISNGVVNGAITPASVASGYGLIPSGMIAMFATACPSGWTRFSALDNAFPMGSATYGTTGGSATHSHSIATDGGHSHTLLPGPSIPVNANAALMVGWDNVVNKDGLGAYSAAGGQTGTQALKTTDTQGSHNHGGATGSASSLPPYLGMVYCQKQ